MIKKNPTELLSSGYLHPLYAESLREFGTPRELPKCGGWILERPIANFPYRDAMGCYPLFCCRDWSKLGEDLDALGDDLVSLGVVTDPFGDYSADDLKVSFKDRVIAFKEHFVVDLHRPIGDYVAKNHRRNAQKALDQLTVERVANPLDLLDDWFRLYQVLIERHNIQGISAFSRQSFAVQLQIPGMVAYRATYNGESVGIVLWSMQNDGGYYHLAAYSESGYDMRASFAIFWTAINDFSAQGVHWLNLGAGAGAGSSDQANGLTRFKSGWSSETRTAYFCGRIFNHAAYDEIGTARQIQQTHYFPAYRQGEFG